MLTVRLEVKLTVNTLALSCMLCDGSKLDTHRNDGPGMPYAWQENDTESVWFMMILSSLPVTEGGSER